MEISNFIHGKKVAAADGETTELTDPSTGEVFATAPLSREADVDAAFQDAARAFDQMPAGYSGPLFLEVSPRTFPILVRKGSRLSQIRFRRGEATLDDAALADLHRRERLAEAEVQRGGRGLGGCGAAQQGLARLERLFESLQRLDLLPLAGAEELVRGDAALAEDLVGVILQIEPGHGVAEDEVELPLLALQQGRDDGEDAVAQRVREIVAREEVQLHHGRAVRDPLLLHPPHDVEDLLEPPRELLLAYDEHQETLDRYRKAFRVNGLTALP